MEEKDYYQLLEVDKRADQRAIREAYRRLAFQYHPDRNTGSLDTAERMKDLNEAYSVLSDKRKRAEYDGLRLRFGSSAYRQFRQSYSDQDIFRGSDINQIFEEMARAFNLRGFNDVFKACYGDECQMFEFRRPGFFGRGFVFVGPSFRRGPRSEAHAPGANLGKLAKYFLKKVGGIEWPQKGKDWKDIITLDPVTVRKGGKVRYVHRRKSKELMVSIPPGIREGQQIRLKGMGGDGVRGGEAGDLYLSVRFRKPFGQKLKDFVRGFWAKAGMLRFLG